MLKCYIVSYSLCEFIYIYNIYTYTHIQIPGPGVARVAAPAAAARRSLRGAVGTNTGAMRQPWEDFGGFGTHTRTIQARHVVMRTQGFRI